MKKRTIIYCVAATIVLFVLSFIFIEEIFELLSFSFWKKNITFLVTEVSGAFGFTLKISLSIAVLPIALMIAWLKGNIYSSLKIIGSIAIVLVSVFVALLVNEFRILNYPLPDLGKIKFMISTENLFYDRAIVLGAAAGSIVAYFCFRSHDQANKRRLSDPSIPM